MRLITLIMLLVLLALAGCPTNQRADDPTAQPQNAPEKSIQPVESEQTASMEFPQAAFDYLLECTQHAGEEGYPSPDSVYEVLAHLPAYPELLQLVVDAVEAAEAEPSIPLVAAWLAQDLDTLVAVWLAQDMSTQVLRQVEGDRAFAAEFVVEKVNAGNPEYLTALMFSPESVRWVLSNLDLAALDQEAASIAMSLLRDLPDLADRAHETDDVGLVRQLAGREDHVRLRAIGQLFPVYEAINRRTTFRFSGHTVTDEQRGQLTAALKSKTPDEVRNVLEGVRVSLDGSLAEELIPLIADVPLEGDTGNQTKPRHLQVASALVGIPGGQAAVMRKRLLKAQDHLVAWRAALGELLHGDPAPWDDRVAELGNDNLLLWTALEVPNLWHDDLLDTCGWAATSDEWVDRQRAAYILNRSAGASSNPRVVGILGGLLDDDVPEVRNLAWTTVGNLRLVPFEPRAQALVKDGSADAQTRLVAAYAALACANETTRGDSASGS